jgi:CheY-like chemotaxis protein
LPDEELMQTEQEDDHVVTTNTSSLTILLVEDNQTNRELAQMVLEQYRHQVYTAESGIVALQKLALRYYDVVFMDVQMPELDGFTTTQLIRSCESGTELPQSIPSALELQLRKTMKGRHQFIIALTAHAMKGDREKCVAAGMDDYLTKPFQPDQVIAILDHFSQNLKKEQSDVDKGCEQNDSQPILLGEVTKNLCQAYGLEERKALELLAKTVPILDENIEQLKAAIENEKPEEIKNVAHSLKGVLLNMWMKEEADLLALVNENCDQGKRVVALDLVEKLSQKLRELRSPME